MIKKVASLVLVPATKWYLRKSRKFRFRNVQIIVNPGVFHPGLFFSTKLLWSHFEDQNLHDKSFVELGCGSGLISILAANKGAIVKAFDISSKAIDNTRYNAELNNAEIQIINSDLFDKIKGIEFDFIAINPPYFKGHVKSEDQQAWYAGPQYEYFDKLFSQLKHFMNAQSEVIMVLSDDCDIKLIESKATETGYWFNQIKVKRFWLETNYLYKISTIRES